jgi:SAM-dependent methyltransferase
MPFGESINNLVSFLNRSLAQRNIFQNSGYCPICERKVKFIAKNPWFRDHYLCSNCGSIPRERALMLVIQTYFPNWPKLVIHESSPVDRGTSTRLARQCKNYIRSQFFPNEKLGKNVNGVRCENLEALTFSDKSIDLHITQDVIEHVFSPDKAFCEIARTLRPGGAHIFTTPLVNKRNPSKIRAKVNSEGNIINIEPAIYHGNPISEQGSLVTVDWGFDICEQIFDACGLFTYIVYIDDITMGIRAEYIEVMITVNPDLGQ